MGSVTPDAAASWSACSICGITASNASGSMPDPRAVISGPPASLPVVESTTTTIEMNPSSPRMRRSFSATSVMSPTEVPSTNT